MPLSGTYLTLIILLVLVVCLYLGKLRPSLLFLLAVILFIASDIISIDDLLSGLSNKQIIVIFLLIILSSGMKKIIGNNFFHKFFKDGLSPKKFLLRMMVLVSSLSAFLNNTPIVAFMIPFVKDWAITNKQSPSKFLIPLSFATILGGMITVVGTSTNLVLNGLIQEAGLPLLGYQDFLWLGLLMAGLGLVYLFTIGYKLLPSYSNQLLDLKENIREYLVETRIKAQSTLINQSVSEAGLRQLQEIFLVEIIRGNQVIAPVSPDEILRAGDILYFAGNTEAIYQLVKAENGLSLPDEQAIEQHRHFEFAEAIIPVNSSLIGEKVKQSNFRQRFNASIIAIRRQGKRVTEQIGETVLNSGDLLLLLNGANVPSSHSDLLFVSKSKTKLKEAPLPLLQKMSGLGAFVCLILGIIGVVDLFLMVGLAILLLVATKVISYMDIKNSIDLDLIIMLISALAIGIALQKSGAASLLAEGILYFSGSSQPIIALLVLFVATILLTSLITNVAAVSMVFPIAAALADNYQLAGTPFFIAIAFAASGDFLTPIGYQTNLMVMGPGNYTFKDYFKIGLPLTLLYIIVCNTFIYYYYLA